MIKSLSPENWQSKQKILVILAHPDDPEFFCGATLARWTHAGHEVSYLLLTRGDKGSDDPAVTPIELINTRMAEQRMAAKVLGVSEVNFLEYPDGFLMPDQEMRKTITRYIRQKKPDIIVTSDPSNYYIRGIYINHPDHRAAGLVTLDAVFPAAGNRLFFPDLLSEGLEPNFPSEVWITLTNDPTIVLDITEFWQYKLDAILQHKSQIADPNLLLTRMAERRTVDSTEEFPRFEDGFRRLLKR
jgi:LmbE family N-acetylglucosaminyl deacetylase